MILLYPWTFFCSGYKNLNSITYTCILPAAWHWCAVRFEKRLAFHHITAKYPKSKRSNTDRNLYFETFSSHFVTSKSNGNQPIGHKQLTVNVLYLAIQHVQLLVKKDFVTSFRGFEFAYFCMCLFLNIHEWHLEMYLI